MAVRLGDPPRAVSARTGGEATGAQLNDAPTSRGLRDADWSSARAYPSGMRSRFAARTLLGSLGCVILVPFGAVAGPGPAPLAFAPAEQLAGAEGGTEPQVAVAPDGARYAITGSNTTASKGTVHLYRSPPSGGPFVPTPGQMTGIRVAGPDVDLVASSTGSLVALEEDSAALSLVVNHSTDGGKTWSASTGLTQLADQDRPWLAAGPHNVITLLFHNGFSANATHNMYVETSSDGGASFGPPVPITLPGSDAFADLQCADSGGPSALLANPTTGRLYAVWGSRHGPLGGCGVLPVTPFTLVPATRIWVATSATGAPGTWTATVAVDNSQTGQVLGMQLSPAALDSTGGLWLAWNTPPHPFPDDSGAGISVRSADPLLQHWTAPVSVIAPSQPGHVLAQLTAGLPGRLGLAYLSGKTSNGVTRWYATASIITAAGGGGAQQVHTTPLTDVPSYRGSATDLMGSGCSPSTGPDGTLQNNPVTCPRSADVIGIAVDRSCRVVITWPSLAAASNAVLGSGPDATWITTQTSGPRLCTQGTVQPTRGHLPTLPQASVRPTQNRNVLAATGHPALYSGIGALLLLPGLALISRRGLRRDR